MAIRKTRKQANGNLTTKTLKADARLKKGLRQKQKLKKHS